MKTLIFISISTTAAAIAAAAAPVTRPSAGCLPDGAKTRATTAANAFSQRQIRIVDFEPVMRTYWVQTPSASPAAAAAAPLLLSFHGQSGDALSHGQSHNFTWQGAPSGLMAVFPQGMNDSIGGAEDQGTGWNVGSAGIQGNATCIPKGVGGEYGCYRSCRKLGKCGRCNWSTCYNDVLFIRRVIASVAKEFCIDLDRVYLHGESNGAELVQHLVREMPEAFAGVVPWFGTPLLGFLAGRQSRLIVHHKDVEQIGFLSLHARQDVTIPPGGGVSSDGWIFEPESEVSNLWAAINGCDSKETAVETQWDGGSLKFACVEHLSCTSKRRVMRCLYDGNHGDWPEGTTGDEITLWFLLQCARNPSSAVAELMV